MPQPERFGFDGPLRRRPFAFLHQTKSTETWLSERERKKPDLMPDVNVERIDYPPEPYRIFYFAHWVATELQSVSKANTSFITECGIWLEQRELAFVLQVAADLRRQPLAPRCAGAPVPRTRSGRPGILPSTLHTEWLGWLRF